MIIAINRYTTQRKLKLNKLLLQSVFKIHKKITVNKVR